MLWYLVDIYEHFGWFWICYQTRSWTWSWLVPSDCWYLSTILLGPHCRKLIFTAMRSSFLNGTCFHNLFYKCHDLLESCVLGAGWLMYVKSWGNLVHSNLTWDVWWMEWCESVRFLNLAVFRVTDVMQSKWGSGVAQSVKCLVCGLDDRGTGSIPGRDKRFSLSLSWAIPSPLFNFWGVE